jgi:hypothetical protein
MICWLFGRDLVIEVLGRGRDDPYLGINVIVMFGLEVGAVALLWRNKRSVGGWLLAACWLLCVIRLGVSMENDQSKRQRENDLILQHYSAQTFSVPTGKFPYTRLKLDELVGFVGKKGA